MNDRSVVERLDSLEFRAQHHSHCSICGGVVVRSSGEEPRMVMRQVGSLVTETAHGSCVAEMAGWVRD